MSKVNVTIDLTRATLVSMLAAYSERACPSAMFNLFADALLIASQESTCLRDELWLRAACTEARALSSRLREDETAIYDRNAPIVVDIHVATRDFAPSGHFTVVVPYTEHNRTEWHPTERVGAFSVLTRGAFATAEEAHAWAADHIPGTAYSVRWQEGALLIDK